MAQSIADGCETHLDDSLQGKAGVALAWKLEFPRGSPGENGRFAALLGSRHDLGPPVKHKPVGLARGGAELLHNAVGLRPDAHTRARLAMLFSSICRNINVHRDNIVVNIILFFDIFCYMIAMEW